MFPALHLDLLKRQLAARLPGNSSHLKMVPPGRALKLPEDQQNFSDSAVLLLLFPYRHELHICLIRRPSTMKNHAGQIAFPGGKREKEDADLIQTALREAHEEIGIDPASLEVLGRLSPVYVEVSSFVITPVLAWMEEKPEIRQDAHEVDEVLLISLERLAKQEIRCHRELETRTGILCVPGFEIDGSFIWGATAMILAELIDLCAFDQL